VGVRVGDFAGSAEVILQVLEEKKCIRLITEQKGKSKVEKPKTKHTLIISTSQKISDSVVILS